MNMENNTCEGGKCNGGECSGHGCCDHGNMGHGCCWNKHHMIKKIVWIVVIIVVFCLGMQLGELKSVNRYYNGFGGKGMMWGYINDGSNWNNVKTENTAPTNTTPAPKQ